MSVPRNFSVVCRELGAEVPLWTQGTGGNVSFKDGDTLWIKASGFRLDAIRSRQGVARLHRPTIDEEMGGGRISGDEEYHGLVKRCATQASSPFPASMESGLHAVLRKRWVMHFHSLAAIVLAQPENADFVESLAHLTGEKIVRLPLMAPGLALTQAMSGAPNAAISILENHGVVLQQDEVPRIQDGVLAIWKKVERKTAELLRSGSMLQALLLGEEKASWVRLLPEMRLSHWARLFPDAAVFEDRARRLLVPAPTVTQPGALRFPTDAQIRDRDAAEIACAIFLLLDGFPRLHEIPDTLTHRIKGMGAEKYRQEVVLCG